MAPFAGAITDRFDKRKLMIGTNVVQGVLALAMAAAAMVTDLVVLQLILLVRVSVGALFVTSGTAALPRLVDRSEIEEANALHSATWSVMFAGGMALGGALSAAMGPTWVIVIDAVTFFVAALVLLGLPSLPSAARTGRIRFFAELNEAWRHARPQPKLLDALLAKTPLAIAGGATWILLHAIADDAVLFGSAALTLGLVQAVRGIGTGVGPLLAARWHSGGMSESRLWVGASLVVFASIAAFSAVEPGWLLLPLAFVWGTGVGANWVMTTSRLQRMAPDGMIGRLSGIDFFAFTTGQVVGAVVGALLADATQIAASSAWLGLALGVGAWLVLRLYVTTRAEPALAGT